VSTKNNHELKNATCFFIRVNSQRYLITNNHVAGLEYFVDEYKRLHKDTLPSNDSIPDNLKVRMYDSIVGSFHFMNVPLFDVNNKPLYRKFYDNNNQASLLDVIAIPIDSVTFANFPVVLSSSQINTKLLLYPACELFVVGFPYDWGNKNLYPIWKKGTIASEPNFMDIGQSRFFIDATTRSGMSGSPVFFRGGNYMEKPSSNVTGGLKTFLVGIYSAQIYNSELGLVTRMDKIFKDLALISK
jgi:hypothetical protein